ncbi:MAG: hypothetical protein HQK63_14245 [Desulfamplus sp.]|nr:hypothetical protein [Desulfamplus sp.]
MTTIRPKTNSYLFQHSYNHNINDEYLPFILLSFAMCYECVDRKNDRKELQAWIQGKYYSPLSFETVYHWIEYGLSIAGFTIHQRQLEQLILSVDSDTATKALRILERKVKRMVE